ncbi:dihydrofolate reductase [Actinomadura pelletieri DSM 43383]|uniref:Dihydrofolate reductase n=1 Tax=Actinomadura pelletieri DSM 43383 TaxID=1120940 RepID=A0A495QM33_9ACTN|nr:dihydrofolate reductase family protein [Actinomadura pelletieri]RKS73585.1 dihydrofolate reductase [Actinomadura pelletieri DSM 43383]
MRKLKLQVQMSVDGYMAGPNGEMDWLTFPWTDDINAYLDELSKSVDTIVMGRRLAEGFIPAWEAGPEGEDPASIEWMNNTPKIVFSRTLSESPWKNAVVENGDLTEVVTALKAAEGGDLIVYGGATFVSGLLAAGLVDELHLLVNPVALGSGMPVFPDAGAPRRLRRVAARPFDCGITALRLEPEHA